MENSTHSRSIRMKWHIFPWLLKNSWCTHKYVIYAFYDVLYYTYRWRTPLKNIYMYILKIWCGIYTPPSQKKQQQLHMSHVIPLNLTFFNNFHPQTNAAPRTTTKILPPPCPALRRSAIKSHRFKPKASAKTLAIKSWELQPDKFSVEQLLLVWELFVFLPIYGCFRK